MTVWLTTVSELSLVFRDALRALVPHLERVRIDWRDGSAYDDWDDIAQTLYEKIVTSSVLWALPEEERKRCEFPKYNMTYSSYAGKTLITLNCASAAERLVFHSFTTAMTPFDRVRACRVDAKGQTLDSDFVLLDADAVTYSVETAAMTLVDLAVQV